jgi:UDP-N-acetylmuramate dehydrogenase
VLGEGSNTVLKSDFAGLVILNRMMGIEIDYESSEVVEITVGAGENWHQLVDYTVQKKWGGLENLALIPGLVGAAPIQNIGAYGVELKDSLLEVLCVDRASGECFSLSNEECHFAYRDSIFKQLLCDKVVITAVRFRLFKDTARTLSYPALEAEVGVDTSLRNVFETVCAIRRQKLPDPNTIPNAGSFFKNPVVSASQHTQLKQRYPDLVSFEFGTGYKLAAAWLIDRAGWKKKSLDDVHVHQHQALVICNPMHRSGQAVLALAFSIQQDIRQHFGVELEIEPRIY